MIYNLNGNHNIPNSLHGQKLNVAYDVYGDAKSFNILLDDNFNEFNTDIWSCLSGPYRGWQYLPEDYTNNAFVEDGKLVIRNLKNNPMLDYEWSGACIQSKNKFQFQYGTVISRIKFPSDADNYHATLWMLGENQGEIDIAESDSGLVWSSVHWYEGPTSSVLHSKNIGYYPIQASEYHEYQLDWTAEKITIHFDGKLLGSFNVEEATINGYNSFRQPYYLIYNTNPYSTSHSVYATSDSVTNYVDYIKVYGESQS